MGWIKNPTPDPGKLEMSDFAQALWWWLLDTEAGEAARAAGVAGMILGEEDLSSADAAGDAGRAFEG